MFSQIKQRISNKLVIELQREPPAYIIRMKERSYFRIEIINLAICKSFSGLWKSLYLVKRFDQS